MERINQLINMLDEQNLDGMLVTSVSNVMYLSGFTGEASALLVSKNGCGFFTDGRYIEQAQNECYKDIVVTKWLEDKRQDALSFNHFAQKYKIKRLGFEGDVVTVSQHDNLINGMQNIELVSVENMIQEIRQIKDSNEIENIRIASQISDKALEETLPFVKEGATEMEIVAKLEYNLKMNGATGISFDTMVLSGAKTSLLHGQPSDKKLEKGDFVLFDFGALYHGYHADISRTFIIGEASEKQIEFYNIIKTAQEKSIEGLKADISSKKPDDIVREIIPKEHIEYYYPGLGHCVGLDIHEQPYLGQSGNRILRENMVLTVEPGLYVPNWGGLRIEDTVLITKTGYEVLNKFPKKLMIL